jgi:hypothetical protein
MTPSDFFFQLLFVFCFLSHFVFSRILSVISLPEVGSGVPNRRHRVEHLISVLSWLLRHSLLSNRSSIVDLVSLGNVLSEAPPTDGQIAVFIHHVTILYASCQRMTSRTDKVSAGVSRAACRRPYRKRKRTCRTTEFSTLILETKVLHSLF